MLPRLARIHDNIVCITNCYVVETNDCQVRMQIMYQRVVALLDRCAKHMEATNHDTEAPPSVVEQGPSSGVTEILPALQARSHLLDRYTTTIPLTQLRPSKPKTTELSPVETKAAHCIPVCIFRHVLDVSR